MEFVFLDMDCSLLQIHISFELPSFASMRSKVSVCYRYSKSVVLNITILSVSTIP